MAEVRGRSRGLAGMAAGITLAGVLACGGEPAGVNPPPPPPPAAAGALQVAVSGLPAGTSALVNVTGPGGFLTSVPASRTIADLVAGQYTIEAAPLLIQGATWSPTPPTQVAAVAAGATATASVGYAISTGSLSIALSGVPLGASAAVTVAGPGGFQASVTTATTLSGLAPGPYTVTADPITFEGDGYAPAAPAQEVIVAAGTTPAEVAVGYALATGRLAVELSGVPPGATPAVTLTGPGGYHQVLTTSGPVTTLAPGAYTLTAAALVAGGITYQPAPASQQVAVAISQVPVPVTVSWSAATGSLAVTSAGLPAGLAAAISVSGPGGYAAQLQGTGTLDGLVPGSYTVSAASVASGGVSWIPTPAAQPVTVTVGATASASVLWSAVPGSLNLTISGLPPGTPAAVTVTGPGGFQQAVTASTVLPGLAPGSYQIVAAVVESGGTLFAPAPASQELQVGSTAASAAVNYTATTGALTVTITGLPEPRPAVTVTGPAGFNQVLSATTILTGLAPGSYQVAAATVGIAGSTWAPAPANQSVGVSTGVAAGATVTYTATTGAVQVTVTGLPGGVLAAATLEGPGGASVPVTGSATIPDLAPGNWTLSAGSVAVGADTYFPLAPSQPVVVTAGAAASITLGYVLGGPTTMNLRIATAYLTQAIQTQDHAVNLVAGRDAYLRVFAVANEINSAQPRVRVRLFHGSTEVGTWMLDAPAASVPTGLNESQLLNSWNLLVPGAFIVPGLRLLAEVDPGNVVPELTDADNFFPADGNPMSVVVRDLPPFGLRLVPVLQSSTGMQGDVTNLNAPGYVTELLTMMPISDYDVDVREVYTTSALPMESNNTNGAWSAVLSEILALRNTVDVSDRYYYGVVKVSHTSGLAGLGYVGAPTANFKAAIGWDHPATQLNRAGVLAHEVGHNFGRLHAPGCGAGNPDPGYPHPTGSIRFWGLDLTSLALKPPSLFTDLMGYCNNVWVSDYTWNAVVNFRSASPTGAPTLAVAAGGTDDGLLIWGRITGAGVVIEPAFRIPATGRPAPTPGPYRVEGRDAAGVLLFSYAFAAAEVADLPGGPERHFAFVVPAGGVADRLASLRVSGPGVAAAERRPPPGAPRPARDPEAARAPGAARRLTWDAASHPMALVRNAATGEILSFARGGEIVLRTVAEELDIQLSDGVRVERRRVVVR